MMVGLATLGPVPSGFWPPSTWPNTGPAGWPRGALRGRTAGGRPFIIIGVFAYAVLVKPGVDFSGWAGAFALGVMMIPIVMRASEEVAQAGAALAASRQLCPGRHPLADRRRALLCRRPCRPSSPAFSWPSPASPAKRPRCCSPPTTPHYWPRSPGDRHAVPDLLHLSIRGQRRPGAAPLPGPPPWCCSSWSCSLNVGIRLVTGRRQPVGQPGGLTLSTVPL